ncbi:MAG: hypothetical protein NXI10_09750 [bacterium]|nr:hypothetical protein [bacterium]
MHKTFYLIFLNINLFLTACGENVEKTTNPNHPSLNKIQLNTEDRKRIYSERIDGPANIRSSPNGPVLFSLNEDVVIDVGLEIDGWYNVLYYADLKYQEFGLDSIEVGRPIINGTDTVGIIKASHSISTGQAGKSTWAILYGFTHKNNIKPESIIENQINKKIQTKDWSFDNWNEIITLFDLELFAISDDEISTYSKNESTAIDFSPGLRILLIFDKDQLVGIIHSRKINNEGMSMHSVIRGLKVSFVEEYPKKKQHDFLERFERCMIGAD